METNLLVAGFGGQGVMMLGKLLSSAACYNSDKKVTFFPSYGAEQRGGTANCFVVLSDDEIANPVGEKMDDLIVMNGPSLKKFLPLLKEGGNLFINSSIVTEEIERTDVNIIKAPVTEMALKLGNSKVLNVIMLGTYIGYTKVLDFDTIVKTVEDMLGKKPDLVQLNKDSLKMGYDIGAGCAGKSECIVGK
ncbi:MAG: pyruvate ferredoxin oxidoreductase [Clostridiales bacterium]|nr:pyruvate ferredoxin oxidoreductase [Clostridiales bacterium]